MYPPSAERKALPMNGPITFLIAGFLLIAAAAFHGPHPITELALPPGAGTLDFIGEATSLWVQNVAESLKSL
jgi:hypothetical protein